MRSIWCLLIFLCGFKNLWAGFNRCHIPLLTALLSPWVTHSLCRTECNLNPGRKANLGSVVSPRNSSQIHTWISVGFAELTASERFSGSLYWSGCCKILSSVTKSWIASLTIVGRYCLTFALKVFSFKLYPYISSLIKVRTFQRYKTTQNWQLCCDWWR